MYLASSSLLMNYSGVILGKHVCRFFFLLFYLYITYEFAGIFGDYEEIQVWISMTRPSEFYLYCVMQMLYYWLSLQQAGKNLCSQAKSRQVNLLNTSTTHLSLQFSVHPAVCSKRETGTEHNQIWMVRQICHRK